MPTTMDQRVFLPTRNLAQSIDFYRRMGWQRQFSRLRCRGRARPPDLDGPRRVVVHRHLRLYRMPRLLRKKMDGRVKPAHDGRT